MKIVTFQSPTNKDRYRVGVLTNENEILDLTSATSKADLTATEVLETLDLDGYFYDTAKALVDDPDWEHRVDRREITLSSPVPRPGKIICIGLNYCDHAAESGMEIPKSPIIFSK